MNTPTTSAGKLDHAIGHFPVPPVEHAPQQVVTILEVPVEASAADSKRLRQGQHANAADSAGSEKLHGRLEPVILGESLLTRHPHEIPYTCVLTLPTLSGKFAGLWRVP